MGATSADRSERESGKAPFATTAHHKEVGISTLVDQERSRGTKMLGMGDGETGGHVESVTGGLGDDVLHEQFELLDRR